MGYIYFDFFPPFGRTRDISHNFWLCIETLSGRGGVSKQNIRTFFILMNEYSLGAKEFMIIEMLQKVVEVKTSGKVRMECWDALKIS